jgi:S1-C subfamily serine protease
MGYGPNPWAAPPKQIVVQTVTRRNWVWIVGVAIVVAAVVGAGFGAFVGVKSQQTVIQRYFPNQSVLNTPSAGDIQAILAKVEPSVVSIDTVVPITVTSKSGQKQSQLAEGAGTGMIITSSGEVLTNNHVVAGATTVTVTLFDQTEALSAHVIGTDPADDVALVQIEDVHGLPTVQLGDSGAIQVGDQVVAVGNALALQGGPTVTTGIVSATNRTLSSESDFTHQSETLHGLLQTQAPINPGNSGGPLVNSKGEVIGMNTATAESSAGNAPAQNIGFAIAINTVKPLVPGLLTGGTGGTSGTKSGPPAAVLGVSVQNVTPALQKQLTLTPSSGALVTGVTSGGPANQAGLKVNDVITAIGATPVATVSDLHTALAAHTAGQTVLMTYYRGPNKVTVSVTFE